MTKWQNQRMMMMMSHSLPKQQQTIARIFSQNPAQRKTLNPKPTRFQSQGSRKNASSCCSGRQPIKRRGGWRERHGGILQCLHGMGRRDYTRGIVSQDLIHSHVGHQSSRRSEIAPNSIKPRIGKVCLLIHGEHVGRKHGREKAIVKPTHDNAGDD